MDGKDKTSTRTCRDCFELRCKIPLKKPEKGNMFKTRIMYHLAIAWCRAGILVYESDLERQVRSGIANITVEDRIFKRLFYDPDKDIFRKGEKCPFFVGEDGE